MTVKTGNKRIYATVSAPELALLELAAELEGKSVTRFVSEACVSRARRVVEREFTANFDPRESKRFLTLIESPPPPVEMLWQTLRRSWNKS